MEFDIEECAMLIVKRGKREIAKRIELVIWKEVKCLEKKKTTSINTSSLWIWNMNLFFKLLFRILEL